MFPQNQIKDSVFQIVNDLFIVKIFKKIYLSEIGKLH